MKGQLSFVEYLVSFLVFITFISYFFLRIINETPIFLNEIRNERIRAEAFQLSEILVNDPGEPINWETSGSPPSTTFIDADFESDREGFVYQDDLYRGTNNPFRERGRRESSVNCASGSCLEVGLNMQNPCNYCGAFSGGWVRSFDINSPTTVRVSFDYTLRLDKDTELDEFVYLYYRDIRDGSEVQGDFIVHNNPPTDEYKSGSVSYTTGMLPTGTYTFDAGCYFNKGASSENAECWIDNVLITETAAAPPPGTSRRLGLSDVNSNKTNLLSLDKINQLDLECSNYYNVKNLLGSDHDFSIILKVEPNGPILLNCYPPQTITRTLNVTVKRIVAINDGSYGEMTIQMW